MNATLLAVVLTASLVQAAPRSNPQGSAEKGEIRGRVTDQETGRPLAGCVVYLSSQALEVNLTARTDDAGAFRFLGLAPGTYNGFVDAGPFRGTHLMQPLVPASSARPFELRKDEIREIRVALPRAFAIGVRIVDPDGDPLSDVRVTVRRADPSRNPAGSWQRTTDDRGWLRVFGLAPGRYTVCAEGEALGSTGPDTGRRERLLRTCYPSSPDGAEAEVVEIVRSDLAEIEIRMRRGRTYTVAGRILDAAGAPAAGAFAGLGHYVRGGSSTMAAPTDADGRFRITNVHPGVYAIEASLGGPDRPEQRRPYEAAFVPITVDGEDLDDLIVMMRKGVAVPGRVVLDDPSLPFPVAGGSGFMVSARLADDGLPGSGSSSHAILRTDRTFTLEKMFGSRRLRFDNVPRGWYVKSVRHGGREVIDEAVEFKESREPVPLEVVLSNRGALVSGGTTDDQGKPTRAMILLFRMGDKEVPPLLAATTSAPATGAFRIGPLRPGGYRIVAVPSTAPSLQAGEWERAAKLAALGEPLTLAEFDERTIDLRLVTPDKK